MSKHRAKNHPRYERRLSSLNDAVKKGAIDEVYAPLGLLYLLNRIANILLTYSRAGWVPWGLGLLLFKTHSYCI
jgi:tRNA(Phe) wybutosine-synthesizing methylase Tyw3